MKITCLPKEGRRLVMTVYVDDEPWVDVHTKIFGRSINLPSCDSVEQLQKKFIDLEYAKARKYTLDCLAMRSYPSTQLKKLLVRNLISAETIQKVLEEFTRLGYLKDEEWIERFIQAQLGRHVGPQMIIGKLLNKGIPLREAKNWIEKTVDETVTQKSIQHLLKTKYKNRNLSDYREKQKVFAALARKGFDTESIKQNLECDESL